MHFFALATAVASLVSAVSAATILVKVGENNGTTFNPTSVTAAVGDQIAFQFIAKNHTVTQSTFGTPCSIMTTPTQGIDSGFQAVPSGAAQIPEWSFTVNNASAPLWFFCAQTGHCTKGMVFAVNPPATGNKTFAAFQAAAMNSTASPTTPPAGGALTTRASAAIVAIAAGAVGAFLL